MTKPKVVRVRATASPDGLCTGCLGCAAQPEDENGELVECGYPPSAPGRRRQDFIFIHDTPKARAAYLALVLEHGLQPD